MFFMTRITGQCGLQEVSRLAIAASDGGTFMQSHPTWPCVITALQSLGGGLLVRIDQSSTKVIKSS